MPSEAMSELTQLKKAIRRKNRLIHRLRHDNPHFRRWCWLYWGEYKNPWVDNEGYFPERMPHDARMDVVRSDGTEAKGLSVVCHNWYMIAGLEPYIIKWRFHNSRREQ